MLEPFLFFASGCVFGLAGGFTPGAMTALVIAQTLRFGLGEGLKVAITPLLTDAPIIGLSLLLVGQLARVESALGVITFLGAAFLIYLAIENFRARGVELRHDTAKPQSLRRGVMVNLLNPHPYLFWSVIGAPILLKAARDSALAAILFIAGLYVCLVGTKMLVALVVAHSRSFLNSRGYVYVNRFLGVALVVFACLFIRDSLTFLGIIPP
ncbi:MAG: LysE family translocator [Phycisphaerae bacterium]|nr:LysE family translocator [Phycisphaerae bacterium]